eukprot:358053-Chlamydomonas_euryale.AAC.2
MALRSLCRLTTDAVSSPRACASSTTVWSCVRSSATIRRSLAWSPCTCLWATAWGVRMGTEPLHAPVGNGMGRADGTEPLHAPVGNGMGRADGMEPLHAPVGNGMGRADGMEPRHVFVGIGMGRADGTEPRHVFVGNGMGRADGVGGVIRSVICVQRIGEGIGGRATRAARQLPTYTLGPQSLPASLRPLSTYAAPDNSPCKKAPANSPYPQPLPPAPATSP